MKQQRALKWAALALGAAAVIGLSGWAMSRWYPAPIDKLTDLTHPTTYEFKTGWLKQEATVVYPAAALRADVEGSVILSMMVEADGRIASSQVYESSGTASLDEAALAASRDFKIDPAQLGADAFPFEKLLKVSFRLESIAQ